MDVEKVLAWHGFLPEKQSGNELLYDCLWCGKEAHLSVNNSGEKAGLFQCFVCGKAGNIHNLLYKIWFDAYTRYGNEDEVGKMCVSQLELLSANRSEFPIENLLEWGIAYNLRGDSFVVPIFKSEGESLLNLAKLDSNYRMMGCPGLRMGASIKINDLKKINATDRVILLTEGIWDAIAVDLFTKVSNVQSKLDQILVVSLPGCMSFNEKIMRDLNISREDKLIILFDNDDPGRAGVVKVLKNIRTDKVWALDWKKFLPPENDAAIKDIRDLYDASNDLKSDWNKVKSGIVKAEELLSSEERHQVNVVSEYDDDKVTSFSELIEIWKDSNIWVSEGMMSAIACSLASVCACSEHAPKTDQLWLRIIGPPGCGKTTIAESISTNKDYVRAKSIITGIHSGWGRDSNLFDELRNRALIIKDADTIANMPNYSQIMSELRDIYDGTSRAHYRNRVRIEEENIRMSVILCGTYSLYKLNNSSLGERFLDIELIDKNDEQHIIKSNEEKWGARLNKNEESADDFKLSTAMYISYLRRNYLPLFNRVDKGFVDSRLERIKQYASFISRIRTKKIDSEEYAFPIFEVSSRLFNQLMNLLIHLMIVLNDEHDKEEMIDKIIWRVVKSTVGSHSVRWKILEVLKNQEMTADSVAESLNLSTATVRNYLVLMGELGLLKHRKINSEYVTGRSVAVWTINDSIKSLLDHH